MPILDSSSFNFFSRSSDQTRRVGMRLGSLLKSGDIIHLVGDLGSGKTTLIQGLAAGWGSIDQVTSPTFVIINLYSRADGEKLFHMDAYRLNSAEEAVALGIEEMLESGPLVIEWANQIKDALPEEKLIIELEWIEQENRQMRVHAVGERYNLLLSNFQKSIFGGD
jgi:tRNA threonylcarbamoyladenosine biosynthesis protein TsaE